MLRPPSYVPALQREVRVWKEAVEIMTPILFLAHLHRLADPKRSIIQRMLWPALKEMTKFESVESYRHILHIFTRLSVGQWKLPSSHPSPTRFTIYISSIRIAFDP
jgi:hypothetical protein